MKQYRYADVRIRFLRTSDGGRQTPAALCGGVYRPHIRVGGDGEYLGVVFVSGPVSVLPGEEADATVSFIFDVDDSPLQPGVEFEVLEGLRVVARGTVQRRWESERAWHSWHAA